MSDARGGPDSPFDSFARRLGKVLKKSTPAPAASPPAQGSSPAAAPTPFHAGLSDVAKEHGQAGTEAPRGPATDGASPFDSFAKRLNKVQSKADAQAAEKAQTATPEGEVDPFDSFARRLDQRSRDAVGAAETSGPGATAPPPESAGPVGAGEHVVKQGECISSIARDSGHFWETIWNDPANSELCGIRKDPNVLLPNDRVYVPARREKWESRPTELRHRFRRRGEPAVLRLTLAIDDVPLANEPYTLTIDGQSVENVTDAEGKLQQPIPPNARHGHLVVGAEKQWTFELELGHIDPVENLAGVQKRLINLGFDCGRSDGRWDEQSSSACRQFQNAQGLTASGNPDDATRVRLREIHGS